MTGELASFLLGWVVIGGVYVGGNPGARPRAHLSILGWRVIPFKRLSVRTLPRASGAEQQADTPR